MSRLERRLAIIFVVIPCCLVLIIVDAVEAAFDGAWEEARRDLADLWQLIREDF